MSGYPDVVCNSEYVYDLAIDRLTEYHELYSKLLGSEANIGSDNEIEGEGLDS